MRKIKKLTTKDIALALKLGFEQNYEIYFEGESIFFVNPKNFILKNMKGKIK